KTFNKKALIHTITFLIGFSLVFIVIGFSTNYIAEVLVRNNVLIRQLGAVLIIFFGLVIIGVFNFEFLMKDKRVSFKNRPSGFIGSFLIGLAFSLGWTPCTGPILAMVITLAADDPERAVVLMTSYALGFAVPFLILSFFVGKMQWIKRNS